MKRIHGILICIIGLASASISGAVPITYTGAGNSGINSTTYSFTATGSGSVTAYFAGETASYGSVIGMLVNGSWTGIAGLQNHSSAYGASLNLGSVTAGDVITFFLAVDKDSSFGPASMGQVDYGWASNPAWNSDGLNHIYSSSYGGDALIPAGTYVGFEDLPDLGDRDYDDHQFVFTGPFRASNAVPEGGSGLVLMGIAAIGIAILRRKLSR